MRTTTAAIPATAGRDAAPSRGRTGRRHARGVIGPAPSADRIRARAYEIYETRRRTSGAGDAISDWLQAEREVCGAAPNPTPSAEVPAKTRARGEVLLADDE